VCEGINVLCGVVPVPPFGGSKKARQRILSYLLKKLKLNLAFDPVLGGLLALDRLQIENVNLFRQSALALI